MQTDILKYKLQTERQTDRKTDRETGRHKNIKTLFI